MAIEAVPGEIYRVITRVTNNIAAAKPESTFGFWYQSDENVNAPGAVLTEIETAMDAFYGTGADGIREAFATSASITATIVEQPLRDPPPTPVTRTLALAGTGGSASLPPDLAMVISWRTALAGPAFRGRTYLGPLGNLVLDSATGLIKAAERAFVQSAADGLIAALDLLGTGLGMCTVSRFVTVDGVTGPRVPPLAEAITLAVVDSHFDVQRRRGVA